MTVAESHVIYFFPQAAISPPTIVYLECENERCASPAQDRGMFQQEDVCPSLGYFVYARMEVAPRGDILRPGCPPCNCQAECHQIRDDETICLVAATRGILPSGNDREWNTSTCYRCDVALQHDLQSPPVLARDDHAAAACLRVLQMPNFRPGKLDDGAFGCGRPGSGSARARTATSRKRAEQRPEAGRMPIVEGK